MCYYHHRLWYPSCVYLGFYEEEDRSVRRRAVDTYGKVMDAWWEFRDGAWVFSIFLEKRVCLWDCLWTEVFFA